MCYQIMIYIYASKFSDDALIRRYDVHLSSAFKTFINCDWDSFMQKTFSYEE